MSLMFFFIYSSYFSSFSFFISFFLLFLLLLSLMWLIYSTLVCRFRYCAVAGEELEHWGSRWVQGYWCSLPLSNLVTQLPSCTISVSVWEYLNNFEPKYCSKQCLYISCMSLIPRSPLLICAGGHYQVTTVTHFVKKSWKSLKLLGKKQKAIHF